MTIASPHRLLAVFFAFFCAILAQPAAATSVVTSFERTAAENAETVTIRVDSEPESEIILLRNPDRIALDLSDTLTAVRPELSEVEEAIVSGVRDGLVSADRYRIIFELSQPAIPRFTSRADGPDTVLELVFEPVEAAAFVRAARDRAGRTVTANTPEGEGGTPTTFTVVLDPGHGGADNGAVGRGGTQEKDLNLAFAKVLRDTLAERDEALDIILTREEDELIPLAERSNIARRAGADLFISIHADSIRYRDLRGATVYTLSARASDALSSEIAERENAADRFVGNEWTQDTPEIHDILVDLVKRETETLSQRFADELVIELRRADVRLINNPKRSAGFRVLMAPDVPSVLLEMGYLSNEDDEALMQTREWQEETAAVVAGAIADFVRARAVLAGQP
ncbi:N-acetylmuramoyl-L-alanine amidase [Aureimonas mangrovi]|uniref:N-acetylmuramoyl-L-alanine amidase n=1 Tax=Aureimonas mangrovi TaxID=2758041 RepID=UPI00163DD0C2|nr:N-acetylmuramoyl-L-alanine amidase [Aureimonas mangrovi]